MIDLLGKRPFAGRSDEMDKWLDEHKPGQKQAPPSLGPEPYPVAMKEDQTDSKP